MLDQKYSFAWCTKIDVKVRIPIHMLFISSKLDCPLLPIFFFFFYKNLCICFGKNINRITEDLFTVIENVYEAFQPKAT